jgi:CRP/FNR family cyclic AMP-dependent transcriptional regulator
VLDGVLASDVLLEDLVSTELLGGGDLLRPWALEAPERLLANETRWTVLAECRLAILDQRFALALSRFPEIYGVLLERMDHRARRLATTQAISELTRVDRRLLAMLWHLAERWGRMTAEGVVIPLDVSHRLLGQLVGARRPTVSTALAELARDGEVERRADGGWLLRGEPTGVPASVGQILLSRRRLMTDRRPTASVAGLQRGQRLRGV